MEKWQEYYQKITENPDWIYFEKAFKQNPNLCYYRRDLLSQSIAVVVRYPDEFKTAKVLFQPALTQHTKRCIKCWSDEFTLQISE